MNDARKNEIETFFQELQEWNRVLVQPAPEFCNEQADERSDESPADRQIFIRVDCDTVALGARKDAKLA